jgi:asparagine synthase (glutamine-hydrolysing)
MWNLDGSPVDPEQVRMMMRAVAPFLSGSCSEPEMLNRGSIGWGYCSSLMSRLHTEDGFYIENNDKPLIILADARLDNRRELAAKLNLETRLQNQKINNAELIAHAYQRWKMDFLSHLIGGFVFVLWDPNEQQILCARDHMGMYPLYYQYSPKRFVFASEIKQILALSENSGAFNESMIGLHLAGVWRANDITFFSEISQIPPAHRLIVSRDKKECHKYWSIDPQHQIYYKTDEEYGQHFKDLFVEAIRCRLRSHETTGISLSGGLDSSSVISVAAWLHKQGEDVPWPLHTFSWWYDELSSADEREYSTAVNELYGLVAHPEIADNIWPLKDEPEYITDWDDPFSGYYQLLFKCLFQKAHKAGIDVLLSGHFGDGLIGGNVFPYPDYLFHGQWLCLASELLQHNQHSHLSTLGLFWRLCVKPAIPRQIKNLYHRLPVSKNYQIPDWITPEFVKRIDLKHLLEVANRYPRKFSPSRGARYLAISHLHNIDVAVDHIRVARRYGLEIRHPWFDKRLVEFVMAIPPNQTVRSGVRKVILRNAMRGILPEKVRTRQGKTYPSALAHRGLRERERSKVKDLLTDTRIAQMGWVIEDRLQQHYDRYLSGDPNTEWPPWQAITLELWLREHF